MGAPSLWQPLCDALAAPREPQSRYLLGAGDQRRLARGGSSGKSVETCPRLFIHPEMEAAP